MATTKWAYHKEWNFASNYSIVLENLFQFLKPVLRQMEREVQNRPVAKNRVLPVTASFFENYFQYENLL